MNTIKTPKKLIEVALPLDDINAACAKEKQPGIGAHPRGLHLWWARRPLAAARAVIYAQMINDPGYERNLGRGVNKEKAKIERERHFDLLRKLVDWENSCNSEVLAQAHSEIKKSWLETCELNKGHPEAANLFNPDRLPDFHDPFAGGGAIPLEALRLGLGSNASDLNPVAVLINKSMIEIPPKFQGRAPVASQKLADKQKSIQTDWVGVAGLAEDIKRYGRWIGVEAKKRIGNLFPKVQLPKSAGGTEAEVIAWIWARTVKSPNPAYSHVDVPLISTYILASKSGKVAWIKPHVNGDSYRFEVVNGAAPDHAENGTKASGRGSNFVCLLSGTPITGDYIKAEGVAGRMGYKLLAIIADGGRGKIYVSPTNEAETIAKSAVAEWRPSGLLPTRLTGGSCVPYGMTEWGDLFTARQLVAMSTFSDLVSDVRSVVEKDAVNAGMNDDGVPLEQGGVGARAYADAISIYLAFAIDRLADYGSTLATWKPSGEQVMQTYKRQALPMTWVF